MLARRTIRVSLMHRFPSRNGRRVPRQVASGRGICSRETQHVPFTLEKCNMYLRAIRSSRLTCVAPCVVNATHQKRWLSTPTNLGSRCLLRDVRELILAARSRVAQSVDASLTMLYWQVGIRIRREILRGKRARYGEKIIAAVATRLEVEFGRGFGEKNLRRMVQFAEQFPDRHRGRGYPRTPATPPDMRVRIRRFGGLSRTGTTKRGRPSESKNSLGSAILTALACASRHGP